MAFRLIGFEFRKNFMTPMMAAVIIGLLLINAWKVFDVHEQRSILSKARYETFGEVYWRFYEEYSGRMSVEKIEKLLNIYRPIKERVDKEISERTYDPQSYTYNDYLDVIFFEQCFIDEMEYAYRYQNSAYGIVTSATRNMEFYEQQGNGWEYEKNRQIAELFQGRSVPDFYYTENYYYYLFYDYSTILVLFICVFAMSGVFVVEKETQMNRIIATARNGGTATSAAKIAASALFVLLVCAVFWIEDYLAFGISFHRFDASGLPLYALSAFRNTPLRISLGQFSLLMAAVKTVGMMGCSLIFLGLSGLSRKILPPFFAGLFMTLLMIFVQGRSTVRLGLKCLNPMELVIGRDLLMDCVFVDLFRRPVLLCQVVIVGNVVFIVMLAGFLIWINRSARKDRRRK